MVDAGDVAAVCVVFAHMVIRYKALCGQNGPGFSLWTWAIKAVCLRSSGKRRAPDHPTLVTKDADPTGKGRYSLFFKVHRVVKRVVENSQQGS